LCSSLSRRKTRVPVQFVLVALALVVIYACTRSFENVYLIPLVLIVLCDRSPWWLERRCFDVDELCGITFGLIALSLLVTSAPPLITLLAYFGTLAFFLIGFVNRKRAMRRVTPHADEV
jgi:hypothetical protein